MVDNTQNSVVLGNSYQAQHTQQLTQEELLILDKLKNNPHLMDKLLHND